MDGTFWRGKKKEKYQENERWQNLIETFNVVQFLTSVIVLSFSFSFPKLPSSNISINFTWHTQWWQDTCIDCNKVIKKKKIMRDGGLFVYLWKSFQIGASS